MLIPGIDRRIKRRTRCRQLQMATEIADDIQQNEAFKINHHGKRTDGIVKGMLQHSCPTRHEATNINKNSQMNIYASLTRAWGQRQYFQYRNSYII